MEVMFGAAALALVCAIIAAKWAMELGAGQVRQLFWAIAGFLFGPLALLVLYVRALHERRDASGARRPVQQLANVAGAH